MSDQKKLKEQSENTDNINKGDHVKVISGKRNLGKAGKVFWKKNKTIGIKTKTETIFTDEQNCKIN